jgi:hypothetical protein
MARTQKEIYNEMTATKESDSELDSLLPNPDTWDTLYTLANFRLLAQTIVKDLSPSLVAIWRLIFNIVSYQLSVIEAFSDIFQTEVNTTIDNKTIGQLPWYVTVSKEFQYGDTLEWSDINNKYEYAVEDATLQIITQAAASVSNGQVIVKVAKGVIGSQTALSAGELSAFENYMKGSGVVNSEDGIVPAGIDVNIISKASDDMKLAIKVFVDTALINLDGTSTADSSTMVVEDAIDEYIQRLPFNSEFLVSGMVDAAQAVDGVYTMVVNQCQARTGSLDYTDILLIENQGYTASAGYLALATNFGWASYFDFPTNTIPTIEYIRK